ncbi:hypothetical protein NDU88_002534 [Pleurodeles waltl]|uniref:Uncharacterized protein n=1 Tax=Pleurodeles waltl TaxID=8319 RepID=A0AAV7VZZ4_PLEWA|nr:hypothetical protein NDU88_002534 [Pleurodeles waltl]
MGARGGLSPSTRIMAGSPPGAQPWQQPAVSAFLFSARGPPLLTRCAAPLPFAVPRAWSHSADRIGPGTPPRGPGVHIALHVSRGPSAPTGAPGPSGRRRVQSARPPRRLIQPEESFPSVRLTSFSRPSRHASMHAPRGCPALRVSSRSLLPTVAHFSLPARPAQPSPSGTSEQGRGGDSGRRGPLVSADIAQPPQPMGALLQAAAPAPPSRSQHLFSGAAAPRASGSALASSGRLSPGRHVGFWPAGLWQAPAVQSPQPLISEGSSAFRDPVGPVRRRHQSVGSGFFGRMTEGSRALSQCDRHLDARSHAPKTILNNEKIHKYK